MRILFTVLLLLIVCPFAGTSRADEKSDCLNACVSDKRSSDMYCPPAGGYSDEDHKQCMEKNGVAYNDCVKGCSPAPASSEPPPAVTDHEPVPSAPTEQPATTDSEPPVPPVPAEPSAVPAEDSPDVGKQL